MSDANTISKSIVEKYGLDSEGVVKLSESLFRRYFDVVRSQRNNNENASQSDILRNISDLTKSLNGLTSKITNISNVTSTSNVYNKIDAGEGLMASTRTKEAKPIVIDKQPNKLSITDEFFKNIPPSFISKLKNVLTNFDPKKYFETYPQLFQSSLETLIDINKKILSQKVASVSSTTLTSASTSNVTKQTINNLSKSEDIFYTKVLALLNFKFNSVLDTLNKLKSPTNTKIGSQTIGTQATNISNTIVTNKNDNKFYSVVSNVLSTSLQKINNVLNNLTKKQAKNSSDIPPEDKTFLKKQVGVQHVVLDEFSDKALKQLKGLFPATMFSKMTESLEKISKKLDNIDTDIRAVGGDVKMGSLANLAGGRGLGGLLRTIGGIASIATLLVGMFDSGPFKGLEKLIGRVGLELSGYAAKFNKVISGFVRGIINIPRNILGTFSRFVGSIFGKDVGKTIFKGGLGALKDLLPKFLKTILKTIKGVPFIGSLISLGFAYDRFKKGDYIGAGIDILSGVASIFPGIGTGISYGLDALNAILDFKAGGIENRAKGSFNKSIGSWIKDFGNGVKDLVNNKLKKIPIIGSLFKAGDALVKGQWKEAFEHLMHIGGGNPALAALDFLTVSDEANSQSGNSQGNPTIDLPAPTGIDKESWNKLTPDQRKKELLNYTSDIKTLGSSEAAVAQSQQRINEMVAKNPASPQTQQNATAAPSTIQPATEATSKAISLKAVAPVLASGETSGFTPNNTQQAWQTLSPAQQQNIVKIYQAARKSIGETAAAKNLQSNIMREARERQPYIVNTTIKDDKTTTKQKASVDTFLEFLKTYTFLERVSVKEWNILTQDQRKEVADFYTDKIENTNLSTPQKVRVVTKLIHDKAEQNKYRDYIEKYSKPVTTEKISTTSQVVNKEQSVTQKTTEPTSTDMSAVQPTSQVVNKEQPVIQKTTEPLTTEKTSSKIAVQQQTIKPVSDKKIDYSKLIEQVASNTKETNNKLDELSRGFNMLADAISKSGITTKPTMDKNQNSVTANSSINTTGAQKSIGYRSSDLAAMGDSTISKVRQDLNNTKLIQRPV